MFDLGRKKKIDALLEEAKKYALDSDPHNSSLCYLKLLDIADKSKDDMLIGHIYRYLGSIAMDSGDIDKGDKYLNLSLDFYSRVTPPTIELFVHCDQFVSFWLKKNDLIRAEHYLQKFLKIKEKLEPSKLINGYMKLIQFYESTNNYYQAKNLYYELLNRLTDESYEDKFSSAIDKHFSYKGKFNCLIGLGDLELFSRKNYQDAKSFYGQALRLAEEAGNTLNIFNCYEHLRDCAIEMFDIDRANQYYEKMLELEKQLPEYQDISDHLSDAYYYFRTYNYSKAEMEYEKMLNRSEPLKDPSKAWIAFNEFGKATWIERAIGDRQRFLKVGHQIYNDKFDVILLERLGIINTIRSNYTQAEIYLKRALSLVHKLGDKKSESQIYMNLYTLYSKHDTRNATSVLDKLIEFAKANNDQNALGFGYSYLGEQEWIKATPKSLKKALEDLTIALDIFGKQENEVGMCIAYLTMGRVLTAKREFSEAKKVFYNALDLATQNNEYNLQGYGKLFFARTLIKEGMYGEARIFANRALDDFTKGGAVEGNLYCYSVIAEAFYHDREFSKSIEYLERHIDLSEKLGYEIVDEDQKIGHYGNNRWAYQTIVSIYLKELPNSEKAFEYIERSKSRAFLEKLTNTPGFDLVPRNSIPGDLVELEHKLQSKIASYVLQKNPLKDEDPLFHGIPENTVKELNIKELFDKLGEVYDKMSKYDQDYVSMRRISHTSIKQIQASLVANNLDNMIIVEYYYNSNLTDEIVVFIISSGFSKHVPISITDNKLDFYINKFQENIENFSNYLTRKGLQTADIQDYSGYHKTREILEKLSAILIEPIWNTISEMDKPEEKILCFVPHGVLHDLPLHALIGNDKRYIIESFPVLYSPSSTYLRISQLTNKRKSVQNNISGKSCIAISSKLINTQDKYFDDECDIIVNDIFNKSPLSHIYHNMSKTELLSLLTNDWIKKKFDIMHFACHGFFSPTDPLSSFLLLPDTKSIGTEVGIVNTQYNKILSEPDNILTAKEIYSLKFNTSLLTLSACQTGKYKINLGDEFMGLPRALLHSGVDTILVSKWPIESYMTTVFMVRFYHHLSSGNLNKAQCLRESQLSLLDHEIYSHPFFWSPFILIGNAA